MKQKILNFVEESKGWFARTIGAIAVLTVLLILIFIILFLLVASLSIILGFYGAIAGGLLWVCFQIWAAILPACLL